MAVIELQVGHVWGLPSVQTVLLHVRAVQTTGNGWGEQTALMEVRGTRRQRSLEIVDLP